MSIFRNALRIAARHPVYLVVYMVLLSLLGVFMGLSAAGGGTEGDTYRPFDGAVAVIDRDSSEMSQALRSHMGETYELADVADEPFALQDALARGTVSCVLIIPAGYGEDLLAAARSGADAPELECASGYSAQAGALVTQEAGRWATFAGAVAALDPQASAAEVAGAVNDAAGERAEVELVSAEGGTSVNGLATYLGFSAYSITSTIVVCAGMVLVAYGDRDVRRRGACAPIAPWRASLRQILGCGVLAFIAWVWTAVLGFVVFHDAAASLGAGRLALALAALLAYACTPLALTFLLTRFAIGENGLNACGNIVGMAMCFLGGVWMPLALMGPAVQAAAHFSPIFWTNEAIGIALGGGADGAAPGAAGALSGDLLAQAMTNIGITLLFAVAIAAVGLAVDRARRGRVG